MFDRITPRMDRRLWSAWWRVVAILLSCAAGAKAADAPPREPLYRVVMVAKAYDNVDNVQPTYPQINEANYATEVLLHNLDRLAREGWTVAASNSVALVLRKSADAAKMEYLVSSFRDEPLSGRPKDTAAALRHFDDIAGDGWIPCAVLTAASDRLLLRRPRKAEERPRGAEFQIVSVKEIYRNSDSVPPTYPQISPDDYDREIARHNLNRLGREGWRACVASPTVVVFRRTADRQPCEQEMYKMTTYPLSDKTADQEKFLAVLHSDRDEGWEPAAVVGTSELILARPKRAAAK